MDYKIRTIWNVIATIPGTVEPDRWVMVGNHRDAWVYGAVDPGSGTAATLEMCRALGAAVKDGWKPRRTLVYASWDAEEYGLVGSTEWAEEHAEDHRPESRPDAQRRLGRQRAPTSTWAASPRSATWRSTPPARSPMSGRADRCRRSGWRAAAPPGPRASPLNLADPLWDEGGGRPGQGRVRSSRLRPPVDIRSARARTTPRSSTTSACRRSTSGSRDATASITRSTTTSTGWRSSATPSSSPTPWRPGSTRSSLCAPRRPTCVPFRFVPYGEALAIHVDELRLIRARQVRGKSGESGQSPRPARGLRGTAAAGESGRRPSRPGPRAGPGPREARRTRRGRGGEAGGGQRRPHAVETGFPACRTVCLAAPGSSTRSMPPA